MYKHIEGRDSPDQHVSGERYAPNNTTEEREEKTQNMEKH